MGPNDRDDDWARRERDRLLQRAVVGELLPAIFHQLRNPLASITTAVELLLEEASDESVRKDLASILREARRMDLGFQGFAVAGLELIGNAPIAVEAVMKDAAAALKPHAEAMGFAIQLELS